MQDCVFWALVLQKQEEREGNWKEEGYVAGAGIGVYEAGILERGDSGSGLVCREVRGRGKTGF